MGAEQQHPHLDHLFKVGVLYAKAHDSKLPATVRTEAQRELDRYREEGKQLLKQRQEAKTMATKKKATKANTKEPAPNIDSRVYAGRGILFAVADDRESMGIGASTVSVIADAIEDALDNDCETSDEIAAWLTTSSFAHEPSKRVRFNSLLRAGDAIGAQMTRKLYNAYNELAEAAADPDLTAAEKRVAKAEATGFAEALSVMFSPFSCEDPEDARLVNWEMVDHITELFEAEQRAVRRERKGKPQ